MLSFTVVLNGIVVKEQDNILPRGGHVKQNRHCQVSPIVRKKSHPEFARNNIKYSENITNVIEIKITCKHHEKPRRDSEAQLYTQ